MEYLTEHELITAKFVELTTDNHSTSYQGGNKLSEFTEWIRNTIVDTCIIYMVVPIRHLSAGGILREDNLLITLNCKLDGRLVIFHREDNWI